MGSRSRTLFRIVIESRVRGNWGSISKPAFYFFATLVNFIAGKGGNKRKVTTYTS